MPRHTRRARRPPRAAVAAALAQHIAALRLGDTPAPSRQQRRALALTADRPRNRY